MQQRQIAAVAKEQAAASKSKLLPFRHFLQLTGAKEQKLKDKLERYYALKPDIEVYNPIKWWLNYCKEYLNLYILALELHSCPRISSKYKQIFSNTSRMVTPNCNRFSAASLEGEECLRK